MRAQRTVWPLPTLCFSEVMAVGFALGRPMQFVLVNCCMSRMVVADADKI